MTVAVVALQQLGLNVEFREHAAKGADPDPRTHNVRAWNNVWQKEISFVARDEWDLACELNVAVGKLYGMAVKAKQAGELG